MYNFFLAVLSGIEYVLSIIIKEWNTVVESKKTEVGSEPRKDVEHSYRAYQFHQTHQTADLGPSLGHNISEKSEDTRSPFASNVASTAFSISKS